MCADLQTAWAGSTLNDEDGMGDVINLKKIKKRAERDLSAKQADANRVKFGRSKVERARDEQNASRANDLLNQHRIDGKDAS